jgi:hypothetical protein
MPIIENAGRRPEMKPPKLHPDQMIVILLAGLAMIGLAVWRAAALHL